MDVWYDWSRVVRTTKSWASAAPVERTMNAPHPGVWTDRWERRGTAAQMAAAQTIVK